MARKGDRYEEDYSRNVRRRTPKKKKGGKILLFTIEIILLGALLVFLYGVLKADKVEKISINEEDIVINENVVDNESMKGYRNIALFGVDSTAGALGKGTRSDSIMIASIDMDTGDVKIVSVYRDTYLNLGNDVYNKCNAAYAQGGPEQAINMLNMNLDMNITDYITVGFRGLTDAIDSLGGVTISIEEEEIKHLNSYQTTIAEELKKQDNPITSVGVQMVNGLQATAYCRIRYTAGDDFKRAERQREVLMAMVDVAKKSSLSTLTQTLDKILPSISTSLDVDEITSLLGTVAKYNIVASDGFPFADARSTGNIGSKGSVVIPLTLADNVERLHKLFFSNLDYTVSEEVKKYSDKISSDTSGAK